MNKMKKFRHNAIRYLIPVSIAMPIFYLAEVLIFVIYIICEGHNYFAIMTQLFYEQNFVLKTITLAIVIITLFVDRV
jgi:ABC-type dipeptide/oligopeptide/nickel transport system permease component